MKSIPQLFGSASAFWLLLSPAALAIIDENNNGLSDLWEKHHNNGQLFDEIFLPQADLDGDGWTNAQEASAGTNPFDANPPGGHIQTAVHYLQPETYDDDGDGIPDWVGDTYVQITWPTAAGKHYRVFFSTDLSNGSWQDLSASSYPIIGDGEPEEWTVSITQPDGSIPAHLFWRVATADEDSDSDDLTDAEEHELGTSPYSGDTDDDGLSDIEELQAGTDPTFPRIRNFARLANGDGTFLYMWDSDAAAGDWFHLNESQPDGTWKVIYSTTYGSQKLPHIEGKNHYVITLDPATDFLP